MKVTRIRIPAEFRVSASQTRTEVADFKLGKGPCGKVVTGLEMDCQAAFVEVIQCHADGTGKSFHYPNHTLTGRIEVTYGEDLGDDIPGNPSPISGNAGVPDGST